MRLKNITRINQICQFSNYTFQYVVARLSVTYHYTDKTCLFNRCRCCMMYKSEKYKAHKLDEVRDDGAEWIRKTLGLVKAEHVNACGAQGFIARREITREVMAQKLSAALRIMYLYIILINNLCTLIRRRRITRYCTPI